MSKLEELKIAKDYYKAKYRYIQMKIKKLQKSTEALIEYKKTIVDDTITIESISEAEAEPESDNTVSSFFNTMIIQETNSKINNQRHMLLTLIFVK